MRSGRLVSGDLIRLNAWSRTGDLSAELEPYSLTGETGEMVEAVGRARVLVTTAATAGSLARHAAQFSHLLLDEAGQLTEPECLVAAGLLDPSGLLVLAGDPHQLPPVLTSRTAQLYGLAVSLLERLTNSPLYLQDWGLHPSTGGFHSRLVVKLVANYRSHPDIIAVPNNLFYCGELEARASQSKQHRFTGPDWAEELGGATGPLVFRPVSGESQQEPGSHSWQNRAQAWEVARLTGRLLARGVRPEQIGVIAPYTGQAARVREMVSSLTGFGPGLRVGSVEEWQGQERPVIILTTVRSSSEGSRASLGFLACQKRFNVALTRAQSLLVVVGDPTLLLTEPCWREFLRHVVQHGGFTGDTEIPEELLGSGAVLNLC